MVTIDLKFPFKIQMELFIRKVYKFVFQISLKKREQKNKL